MEKHATLFSNWWDGNGKRCAGASNTNREGDGLQDKWDLFISHASEDKAMVVQPLANTLKNEGVKVWYDEFELKLGDSLSRSIDYGLIHSRFGLVVLSKSFFAKQWTEYELQSLLARNTGGERVILPVWHDIKKEDIQRYSLYLSDIMALSTQMGIDKLAVEIMKKVRPDILNSYLRIYQSRKIEQGPHIETSAPLKKLHDSETRHKTLPSYLVIACRLMEEVFHDILNTSYMEMVDNFAKDWDYEREFIVWSAIANAYMRFIRETHCNFEDIPKKKEAFALLLAYSLSGQFKVDLEAYPLLNASEQLYLIECYLLDYTHIRNMLKKTSSPHEETE